MALGSASATSFFSKNPLSGIGAPQKRNATTERRSAFDLDSSSKAVAAHFAQQQLRLRRNIRTVDSDEEWTSMKQTMSSHCGSLVFFRRHGCPSCNCMAPKVSESSNDLQFEIGKDIAFIEVDVVKCPRTASIFKATSSAPAFCVFSHGVHQTTFTGVSTQVFKNHVNDLRDSVMNCTRCTGDMRACFDIVETNLDAVVRRGCLLNESLVSCFEWEDNKLGNTSKEPVPSLERILPFDVSGCDWSVKERLELLEERLYGSPTFWQASVVNQPRKLAKEFLSSYSDDNFLVENVQSQVVSWLKNRFGHPSLWSSDEYQTLTTISNAVMSRRATRAEYWLLKSLGSIIGRSIAHRQWSNDLRASLQSQMSDMWISLRTCNKYCSNCDLSCVLSCNHTGEHYCGDDDHTCHREIIDYDSTSTSEKASRMRCQLHAGHSGICRVRPAFFDPGENCLCAVCLDPLPRPSETCLVEEAERTVAFPCKHAFHSRCAQLCLERSVLCPLCRSPTHASTFRGKFDFAMSSDESPALRRQHSSTRLRQLRRLPSAGRITANRTTTSWGLTDASDGRRVPRTNGRLFPALPPLEHLTTGGLAAPQAMSTRSPNMSSRQVLPPLSGRSGIGGINPISDDMGP